MKKISTLLLFISSFFSLDAQQVQQVYLQDHHLQLGDLYYQRNLNGLKLLMRDLKGSDPELHQQLDPQLQAMIQQRREANIILGVGSGTTLVLFGLAMGNLINSAPTLNENYRQATGLAIGGAAVGIVTSILYGTKQVSRQDLLDFTNRFNKLSTGDKIRWTLHPRFNMGAHNTKGFALSLTF